jgi:hypothetical protein
MGLSVKSDQVSSLQRAKGVCVEIGTWHGGFADALLQNPDVTKLYCVDPYKHFKNGEFVASCNDLTQEQYDDLFHRVSSGLYSRFGQHRVVFLRELSIEAAKQFEDESIDYIYIDGNHEYSYVLSDLQTWWPKVKKGGCICGDDVISRNLGDYSQDGKNMMKKWSADCYGTFGVYPALLDFGQPFTLNETQFTIEKPICG